MYLMKEQEELSGMLVMYLSYLPVAATRNSCFQGLVPRRHFWKQKYVEHQLVNSRIFENTYI